MVVTLSSDVKTVKTAKNARARSADCHVHRRIQRETCFDAGTKRTGVGVVRPYVALKERRNCFLLLLIIH